MPRFPKFGSDVPYAEPSWYRGNPTPYYQEKHVKWRKKVRDFVEKEMRPFASKWDESKSFPLQELRRKAYNAGILSPCYPEHLGGTPPEGGWDEWMNVIWQDELARCGSGGVLIVLIGITVMSLPHTLKFGSDFLKRTVAEPVIRGDEGMCITLTEPEGGSDLANISTTAVKTPCGRYYIVNGTKKFITGGMTNRYFSTLVRTGGPGHSGVSLMMIDKTWPGTTTKKLETQGWWAGNTALVSFEDVKVPVEYLIGDEGMGFPYLVDVMNGERLVAIIGVIRGCRSCIQIAIEFARKRKTFGKRLIDHQVIRHKIFHMAKYAETLQDSLEALTYQMSEGAGAMKIGGPVALLKVQSTQALEFCVREASQILGGASYLRQGKGRELERAAREVRVAAVGGGSEEILIDLASRFAKL
mmetsp:Transcript_4237/g.11836  ORF Transcript_4237/g.11836 Transcript_4237/m.11836 type:complete len:414 (-) Transcript_4237:810-2051(-)